MRGGRHICFAAALAAAASCPAHAQAQQASQVPTTRKQAPSRSNTTPKQGLEEVVVTARRVRENLQKVPVSGSAFSNASLQAHQINQPQDLQQAVPGVFLGGSGSFVNSEYSIRGSAKPVGGAGAPGVVTYLSDVPLPEYLDSTPQYDISSMQVLKGPQGTLFGRNTVGGAILIYPQAPTFKFGGYVQATIGNYSAHDFEGAVNIPIIADKFAIRVAGLIDRSNGYVKNLGFGGDQANQYDNNFRVSALLKPVDWIRNLTTVDFAEEPGSEANGDARIAVASGLPIPAVQAIIAEQAARGPFVTDTGPLGAYDGWRSWGVTNRSDIDLGPVQFVNIFGYRNVFDHDLNNFDGLPGAFYDTTQEETTHQYSEEVQAKGALFQNRLHWLLGGFYSDQPPDLVSYGSDLSSLGLGQSHMAYNDYGETSTAVFGNLNYEILRHVHLFGGARYTWDRFSSCSGIGGTWSQPFVSPGNCLSLTDASKITGGSMAPTWTVGADWEVVPGAFLYVTSRRGYKSGGLNAPALGVGLRPDQTFAPELTTDVEVGAKTDFSIGSVRTRFNVAAFDTETRNDQLIGTQIATSTYQAAGLACVPPKFTPFIDGDCNPANDPIQTVLTINAGTIHTRGAELDLTVSPLQGLVLNAGATLLDTTTDSYNVPRTLALFFPSGGSIPLLFTPKETLTSSIAYTVPVPERYGTVVFNGQYYRSGSVNFYGYVASDYDVVNVRADWKKIFGSGFDLGIFARNLFDRRYVRGPALVSVAAVPANSVLFGLPRQYGVQLRYSF